MKFLVAGEPEESQFSLRGLVKGRLGHPVSNEANISQLRCAELTHATVPPKQRTALGQHWWQPGQRSGLVSYGFCDKLQQNYCLKTTQTYLLTVLEVRAWNTRVYYFLWAAVRNHHKLGCLKQQKLFSLFWSLEVWNQGAGRATLPPKFLGDNWFLVSSASGGHQHCLVSMACRHITPSLPLSSPCLSFVCVSLSLPLLFSY